MTTTRVDAPERGNMKNRRQEARESELRRAVKQFNWKLAAKLAASFIVIAIIYIVCVYYRLAFIVHAYAIALLVLSVAYVVLARGYSLKPFDESQFPDDWDAEQRKKYLESDVKRKKIARTLLLFIIPIILMFMFDMIYINFFSN
jgi:Ca2+/Na+ antiporter